MGKNLKGRELGKGISQRSDGYYLARFTDREGRRQQKLFPELQACRNWLADAIFINDHSDISRPYDLTVDAWYQEWIQMKDKTVRYNTARNYRERYEKNIKPVIGNMLLRDVKPIHLQKIMNNMADQDYTTATMYQTRIALFNMFDYAVENDILVKNPCTKKVKSNIGRASDKKEALTIPIQKIFLSGIKGNAYENQYRFLLQTGLRTGELIGLKWSDIDFQKKVMYISRTMEFRHSLGKWSIGPTKSESGMRVVPLTDEAIKILQSQKRKNSRINTVVLEWVDFVFLSKKGTPVKNSTYDTMLFKICEELKIPHFSMHVLRHTFATRCIEAGMLPKTLQTILGHANISITMNLYVHTTEEQKVKEIEAVANALKVV